MVNFIQAMSMAKGLSPVFKVIFSNPVVKALENVGTAFVRDAFEIISENQKGYLPDDLAFDSAIDKLRAAHQCCYQSRVQNTNPFNLNNICAADYFVCCLISFLYFENGYNKKIIEKYLYHAFCARENTVLYSNKIEFVGKTIQTFFNMYREPNDFVEKLHSREKFLNFCQCIIGKANCLGTEEAGNIYNIGNNSWHQIFLQNRGDFTLPAGNLKPVLGTCSVRIRYNNNIIMKIDECNEMLPAQSGKGPLYPHYYHRIYSPLIIAEKYCSQINHGIPFMKELRRLFKRKSKKDNEELEYYLANGSQEVINHLSTISSIKESLNKSLYLLKINITKDGVYFWTVSTMNIGISQQLPYSLLSTFGKIVSLIDNLK